MEFNSIRPYQRSDYNAMIQMLVDFSAYLVKLDKLDLLQIQDEESCRGYFRSMQSQIRKKNGILMVVEYDDLKNNVAVVGFAAGIVFTRKVRHGLGHRDCLCGRIIELFVKEEFRSKGYALELMSFFESRFFKDNGCEYMYVEVMGDNKVARKFYDMIGFKPRMIDLIKKI